MRIRTCLVLLGIVFSGVAVASGTGVETPNILRLGPEGRPPAATIDQIAWIAGDWHGEALGGEAQEVWSPPRGGSMLGMYYLVKDGKVMFYEILTIMEFQYRRSGSHR